MLEIPTVCPFLRTEDDLPSLKKLEFSNIGIDNFQAIQDCGNDSFTAPSQKTNKVEVKLAVHPIRIQILIFVFTCLAHVIFITSFFCISVTLVA